MFQLNIVYLIFFKIVSCLLQEYHPQIYLITVLYNSGLLEYTVVFGEPMFFFCFVFLYLSCLMGKPTMWFLNRSDTNQAVQAQKNARDWKYLDLERRGIVLSVQRKQRR